MRLESMIRILCRDIEFTFESKFNEWILANAYGIPQQQSTANTFFKISALFPSDTNEHGNHKGGIIVLKLKPKISIFNITNMLSDLIANPTENMFKIKVSQKDNMYKRVESEYDINGKQLIDARRYQNSVGAKRAFFLCHFYDFWNDISQIISFVNQNKIFIFSFVLLMNKHSFNKLKNKIQKNTKCTCRM